MMRLASLPGGLLAVAVLVACSNSSSGGGEVCDNGSGGLTSAMCDGYASTGKCSTHSFSQTPGHPCTMYPNETITPDCCKVNGCTGDTSSFLGQPMTAFPPSPVCGPQDGGSD